MPTRRAMIILALAIALYLIANQTQVGWVYIMTNMLVGLLVAAFFYSRGVLKPIRGKRTFRAAAKTPAADTIDSGDGALNALDISSNFYEDDLIDVTLRFEQTKLRPAFMIAGMELCPFAAPDQQRQPFFIPTLFRGRPVTLHYQTPAYRRGAYTLPPLKLHSTGPFQLFKTRRTVAVPGELLIYPAYHPLRRMRLLENRGFTDKQALRAGTGSEVIGTREYRSGDSLRQIHWRSTARTNRLVVKEFSDHDHLTMTVVLDLSRPEQPETDKFSPFETAVRLAASLGYYATHHNIPFRLVGHSEQWRPPGIALSWWGTLHYLARVQNDGAVPLAEVLRNLAAVPFAVVLVSQPPDAALLQSLAALPRRGVYVLAIVINPDGVVPPAALSLSSDTLKIRSVIPRQWKTALKDL